MYHFSLGLEVAAITLLARTGGRPFLMYSFGVGTGRGGYKILKITIKLNIPPQADLAI